MPCSALASPLSIIHADKLQHAAIEKVQLERLTQIANALYGIEVPTLRKDKLGDLSIALGAQLDVDESPRSSFSDTFFAPCDWPLEVLEYETCDPRTVRQEIGLRLPLRDFHPEPWHRAPYYQYYGKWAQLAPVKSELPHAMCFVLDSGTPDDDAILLSEAEAAAALVRFQLEDGSYTNHHTKPVLVATVLRDHTARLTQGYFDGKRNMLVLRQSRALDLSGREPSQDAWTLLRWMASQPAGETRYATGAADDEGAFRDEPADLTPQISV